jgi:hypothetical protein
MTPNLRLNFYLIKMKQDRHTNCHIISITLDPNFSFFPLSFFFFSLVACPFSFLFWATHSPIPLSSLTPAFIIHSLLSHSLPLPVSSVSSPLWRRSLSLPFCSRLFPPLCYCPTDFDLFSLPRTRGLLQP